MKHFFSDGRYVDFSKDGNIGDVRITDVLWLLSREKRYANEIDWSVLQHSIAVGIAAQQLYGWNEPLVRAAFTHDFGEAFYRDVPTPFKDKVGKAWDAMTHEVDAKLFAALKLDIELGDEDHELLAQVDKAVGYVEALLMHSEECADAYENMEKIPAKVISAASLGVQQAQAIPVVDEYGNLSDMVCDMYLQISKTVNF